MRHQLRFALQVTLLTGGVLSQVPAPSYVAPNRASAWQTFQMQHGHFTAIWSPATGTPRAIFGDGLPLGHGRIETLATARSAAEAALARYAPLLGTAESEFVPTIAQTVGDLHVFVFDQRAHNLRVIGGRADVRVHASGAISEIGATAFAVPPAFALAPAFDAEEAMLLAHASKQVVLAPLARPNAELVLFGDDLAVHPTAAKLAYEVKVDSFETKTVGRVYVDAITRKVLRWVNDLHECSFGHTHVAAEHTNPASSGAMQTAVVHGLPVLGATNVTGTLKGWLNPALNPASALQNLPLAGVRVAVTGGSAAFTDANGNFDIPNAGTTPVTLTASWASGRRIFGISTSQGALWSFSTTATPGTPVAIQVFTSAATQFESAQTNTQYLVDRVNEYCRAIIGSLPATTDQVRATVNLAQTCNAYYSGNQINFYASGGGCPNTAYATVIEHEWGHGLDERYGGISQQDGLSEGWGDLIALYNSGQPLLGLNFLGSGALRTGLNTTKLGDCSEVHCAGESWMGWAWDVRTSLIAKLGSAAGIAKAEKIVLASIVANAANQTDAVRQVFLLDDDDANLNNGTPNCDLLRQACTKRLIPVPTPSCSGKPASYVAYGAGCAGALLVESGLPWIGSSINVGLFGGVASAPALLHVGFSKTTWNSLTLPFDLGALNAPGCAILASGQVVLGATTSGLGSTQVTIAIPNDPVLPGVVFYNQWFVLNPAANPLGLGASGGGQGTIGKP